MTEPRQFHADRSHRWTYIAAPLRAVDGDTIEVMLDKGDRDYSKDSIRIQYVECPELNSPDPEERARAKAAKQFTQDWLDAAASAAVDAARKDDREYPLTVVTWQDRHSFNRLVAVVENLAGEELHEAIIAAGHGVRTDARGKR